MKRNQLLFVSILVIMVMAAVSCKKDSTSDSNPSGSDPVVQQRLQTMVDKLLADYKTISPGYPGGIALKVQSGEKSWFVSSGMGTGVTGQVHFRAASNTKSFTCTAILLLAQEGKLDIDAKISDIIPGTQMTYVPLTAGYQVPFRDQITIRQLMMHRAGVFDVTNNDIPDTVSAVVPYKGQRYISFVESTDSAHTFTFDELVGVAATCRLFYFQPGESYHYSNTGYSILGKIIERVSGKSYSEYIMEHIVKPMGLTNTTFPHLGNDQQIPAPFAEGFLYMPDGEILNVTESNISTSCAEGNMITTPDDLAKFLRNLIQGNGVLRPYWINKAMLVPPAGNNPDDGYGCGIEYELNLGFGHTGALAGFLSRMATDPETDFTVVAFSNAWDCSTIGIYLGYSMYYLRDEACYRARAIVH